MAFLTGGLLDSLSKIMEKSEDGTYDRTTDSNEAISEAVAGLNDVSAAEVNAQCDAAFATYDPPTKGEMDAGFAGISGWSGYTTSGVIVEDGTSGTPNVVTLTASGSANTFGSWTQLDASVSADSYIASIIVYPTSATTIADFCIEIGTGASPATKIRFSFKTANLTSVGYRMPFVYSLPIPIRVASGTKISGRFSTDAGGDACTIGIQYYQGL